MRAPRRQVPLARTKHRVHSCKQQEPEHPQLPGSASSRASSSMAASLANLMSSPLTWRATTWSQPLRAAPRDYTLPGMS